MSNKRKSGASPSTSASASASSSSSSKNDIERDSKKAKITSDTEPKKDEASAIQEGSKVPPFTAKDSNGHRWKLSDFKTNFIVFVFLPNHKAPSAIQAVDFEKLLPEFEKYGASVATVSASGNEEDPHKEFKTKNGLKNLTLLVDDDQHSVSTAFGVWKQGTVYGKTYYGIDRYTFIVDSRGIVRRNFHFRKVESHASIVLESLKEISSRELVDQSSVVELNKGDKAPPFSVKDIDGKVIKLNNKQLNETSTVIFFIPKVGSDAFGTEAKELETNKKKLTELGAQVIVVTPDPKDDVLSFRSSNKSFSFSIVSDPNHELSSKFGARRLLTSFKNTYLGIAKIVFVINKNCEIIDTFQRMGKTDSVQRIVKSLSSPSTATGTEKKTKTAKEKEKEKKKQKEKEKKKKEEEENDDDDNNDDDEEEEEEEEEDDDDDFSDDDVKNKKTTAVTTRNLPSSTSSTSSTATGLSSEKFMSIAQDIGLKFDNSPHVYDRGEIFIAKKKLFSSGRFGWSFAGRTVQVKLDDQTTVPVQLTFNLLVKN